MPSFAAFKLILPVELVPQRIPTECPSLIRVYGLLTIFS